MIAIALYFCLWALVHSLLAGCALKRWTCRAFGSGCARWYRAAFNAVAGLTLLPLLAMILWLPDRTLYTVSPPWRWLSLFGQLLAFVALVWTLLQTDVLRFAGLSQLQGRDRARPESLQVQGFYCYVRHPLYLFSLVIVWLTPRMSASLLTLYCLMTLYFYVGSVFEERKLLVEFGPAYARYRGQVPRFLPRLKPCNPLDIGSEHAVQ